MPKFRVNDARWTASRRKREQVSRLTLHEREVKFQKGDFDDEEEEAGQEKEAASGYHYLLGMPLWNLTHEKVEEMKKHALEKKNEFDELMQTSPEQLWWSDLDDVIAALDEVAGVGCKAWKDWWADIKSRGLSMERLRIVGSES